MENFFDEFDKDNFIEEIDDLNFLFEDENIPKEPSPTEQSKKSSKRKKSDIEYAPLEIEDSTEEVIDMEEYVEDINANDYKYIPEETKQEALTKVSEYATKAKVNLESLKNIHSNCLMESMVDANSEIQDLNKLIEQVKEIINSDNLHPQYLKSLKELLDSKLAYHKFLSKETFEIISKMSKEERVIEDREGGAESLTVIGGVTALNASEEELELIERELEMLREKERLSNGE